MSITINAVDVAASSTWRLVAAALSLRRQYRRCGDRLEIAKKASRPPRHIPTHNSALAAALARCPRLKGYKYVELRRKDSPFADTAPLSNASSLSTFAAPHPTQRAMDAYTTIVIAAPIPADLPADVPVDAESTSGTKQQGCVIA